MYTYPPVEYCFVPPVLVAIYSRKLNCCVAQLKHLPIAYYLLLITLWLPGVCVVGLVGEAVMEHGT